MAHFAKLDEDNNVLSVLVIDNDKIITPEGVESEALGQTHLFNLTGHRKWRQTSYNANFRGNFAGKGYVFDEVNNIFVPPKPYPSWNYNMLLNKWEAPIAIPDLSNNYEWDEQNQQWVLI